VPDDSGLHLPNPITGLAMMGPLARSADDLALAFDLACGPDVDEDAAWKLEIPPARHTRLQDFRVAVMPALDWLPVDSEIVAAQERLAGELSRLGCRVQTVLPEGFGDLKEFFHLYHRLLIVNISLGMPKEQRHEIAEWAHKASQERGDELIEIGAQSFEAGAHDFIYWYGSREHFRMLYRNFFKDWDVLLTPVTFTPAFRHTERPVEADMDELMLTLDGQPVHYRNLGVHPALATLCGQPATAFPVGISRHGLPLALQVIGPYLEDHTPLKFAALAAQVTGGYQAPPGI
jgi:amidase